MYSLWQVAHNFAVRIDRGTYNCLLVGGGKERNGEDRLPARFETLMDL